MVSIRRRRYLGLCGGKNSTAVERHGGNVENLNQNVKPFSVHPISSVNSSPQKPTPSVNSSPQKLTNITEALPRPSNASGSNSSKEEPKHYYPGKEIKYRKRHRRKHYEDQEPCTMRGVYFKNMKWQAAIKVDKKQIHLGTVGSQEEAARLYDRAAFMCGREPNFELSEEEKHELGQYNWEEFLAITRKAINKKKKQRIVGAGQRKDREMRVQNSDRENDRDSGASSASEGGDANASPS